MPTDCIAVDFEADWYRRWARLIGYPAARHPKFWETAAIAEALTERGMLAPGKRGLGMGVGQEALPSIFASKGVFVTATDQDVAQGTAKGWDNGQLAHGALSVFHPHIVDRPSFEERVAFEPYDMTEFRDDFVDRYDFVWHNCAIGHIGSLAASVEQLKRSAQYLQDGGWLVFTTELNVTSFELTVDRDSDTCLWRLSDLRRLFAELESVGLSADRLRLRLGDAAEDLRVNYSSKGVGLDDPVDCEIKIPVGSFAATQVLLCFQKTGRQSSTSAREHTRDARANAKVMKEFAKRSADVGGYFESPSRSKYSRATLTPDRSDLNLTMVAGGTAEVVLKFRNDSKIRIHDGSLNTPYSHPKLDLGTWDAPDRVSVFADASWPTPDRPAVSFLEPAPAPLTEWNSAFNPHRADPGESFEYQFTLRAPEALGRYVEKFALVFEGVSWMPSSAVTITIDVVEADGKSGPAT